jgi:hypothetical protein
MLRGLIDERMWHLLIRHEWTNACIYAARHTDLSEKLP